MICKTWKYESIYDKEGHQSRKIGSHDLLNIRTNGDKQTFSYALVLENIKSTGLWILADSTLEFTYAASAETPKNVAPAIRKFKILFITSEELLFREVTKPEQPGLYFKFSAFSE